MDSEKLTSYLQHLEEAYSLFESPTQSVDTFCHYTDLNALLGILGRDGIWLTDYRFLNDPNEYEYGKHIAKKEIENRVKNSSVEVQNALQALIASIEKMHKRRHFISSMSFSIDNLAMWRLYGKGSSGVCIVFSGINEDWNRDIFKTDSKQHISFRKIIYAEKEQKDIINTLIDIYERDYLPEFQHFFVNELLHYVDKACIKFKSPEYRIENELRVQIANLGVDSELVIQHRIGNNCIVPFISRMSTTKGGKQITLPIQKIITSPMASPLMGESIKVFLENKGLAHIPVESSKLVHRWA